MNTKTDTKNSRTERILTAADKATAPLAWAFERISKWDEEEKALARLAIGMTATLALLSHILNTIF